MKIFALAISFALLPLCSYAGAFLTPTGVVQAAVVSAKDNKLDQFIRTCDILAIKTSKNGPVTPEDAMRILGNIDLDKSIVKLVSEEKNGAIVQVLGQGPPIKLTLSKKEEINGTFYQIIGILVGKE